MLAKKYALVFYLVLYFRPSQKTSDATVISLLPLKTSTVTLQTQKSISTCSNQQDLPFFIFMCVS